MVADQFALFQVVAMTSTRRAELADWHLHLLQLERMEEIKRRKHLAKGVKSTLQLVAKSVCYKDDVYISTLKHESETSLPKHCIADGSRVLVSPTPIDDLEDDEKKKFTLSSSNGNHARSSCIDLVESDMQRR